MSDQNTTAQVPDQVGLWTSDGFRTSAEFDKVAKQIQLMVNDVGLIEKEGEVQDRSGKKLYGYASLDHVLNSLSKARIQHGLMIQWDCRTLVNQEMQPRAASVACLIIHNTSGQWMRSSYLDVPIQSPDPQGLGAAVTYGRRYTLLSLAGIGVAGDDDDGQRARAPQDRSQPAGRQQGGGGQQKQNPYAPPGNYRDYQQEPPEDDHWITRIVGLDSKATAQGGRIYSLFTSDKRRVGTFEKPVAKRAYDAYTSGEKVLVTWEMSNGYLNAVDLVPASDAVNTETGEVREAGPPTGGDLDEDAPF